MTELPQPPTIYQLRLVLACISPMIWRRLLIPSETTIAQLHEYIQISFDWSGEHLHLFRIHGKDYGIASLGGISFDDNPRAVPLSRFRLRPHELSAESKTRRGSTADQGCFEGTGTRTSQMTSQRRIINRNEVWQRFNGKLAIADLAKTCRQSDVTVPVFSMI